MNKSKKRIIAFDLIRGYFMFMLTVNHINRFPSGFEFLTGESSLWVSGAEGFFIISGVLVGYVYGKKIILDAKKVTRKLWLRAVKLYFICNFFTLFFTYFALALGVPSGTKTGVLKTNFFNLIYRTFTFKYVYGFADFLAYFAVFMIFAPLVLYLVVKRKEWLVLVVSFSIWLLRGTTSGMVSFDMGWQILFVTGIVLGYHWNTIEAKITALSNSVKRNLRVLAVSSFAVFISVNLIFNDAAKIFGSQSFLARMQGPLDLFFSKWTMGPGRLVADFILFAALYYLVRSYEEEINRKTLGVLKTLGNTPLYVYSCSAIIVFPILMLNVPNTFLYNASIVSVALAALYILALNQPRLSLALNNVIGFGASLFGLKKPIAVDSGIADGM